MNNIIPSLHKALQLIHQLSETNCTQAELSKKLGITMSTTYRILCTLLAEGWVVKKKDASYMLGGGMLPLLSFFHRDVARMETVRDLVAEIPEKTGLFAKMSIACGNLHHVTIYRADPIQERMQLTNKAGTTFSIVDGPSGVVLLQDKTPDQLRKICRNTYEATPAKENPELMVQAVAECQEKGYSFFRIQKTRWDVMAMAVPVRFEGKIIASLEVIGCTKDFSGPKERQIAKTMKDFAAKCEKAIAEA